MAARLTLVKGPALQKLLVLTLLTLTGLGYPPQLCKADMQCYICQGAGPCDEPVGCATKGCYIIELISSKGSIKSGDCDHDGGAGNGEEVFKCIQEKFGQTGSCIKSSQKDFLDKQKECGGGKRSLSGGNQTEAGEARDGGGEDASKITQVMCACTKVRCNNDELLRSAGGGGDGGSKGGSEASQVMPTGRRIMEAGIIGGIITLLATNWLFY